MIQWDKTLIKTTAFRAYIEVYILQLKAAKHTEIVFSQIDLFDYPPCAERLDRYFIKAMIHSKANTIRYIPWRKWNRIKYDYLPFVVNHYIYIFAGVFPAMTGYVTPKCPLGGLPVVHITNNPNFDPISTFSYFHYTS